MTLQAISACVTLLLGVPAPDPSTYEVKVVTPLELQAEVGAGPTAYAFYDRREIWLTDAFNEKLLAHEIGHLALHDAGLAQSPWHGNLLYWVESQYHPQCALLNTD